jgi:pimeloyl-ACP methyl ester carboxylesterase
MASRKSANILRAMKTPNHGKTAPPRDPEMRGGQGTNPRAGIVRTESGTSSYEYRPGPKSGTVVFIHGFAIPSKVWEKTRSFASGLGHPVLSYDRYGLGASVPADGRTAHTMDSYIRQLEELLETLRPPTPIVLAGLSLGGAVAIRFARLHPGISGGLFLIAPVARNAVSALSRLSLLRGLAPAALAIFGKRILRANLRKAIPATDDAAFIRDCIGQVGRPEYRRALWSCAQGVLFRPDTFDYSGLPARIPACLLWGTEDAVIPFRHAEETRLALGHGEFHPLEGAGHCPPRERPEEVNRILESFLRSLPLGAGSGRGGGRGDDGAPGT